VLRRIVGLHDTSGEQFRTLARTLKSGWTKDLPSRTIRLLDKEVRDKGKRSSNHALPG
jgi:hypothetical protein